MRLLEQVQRGPVTAPRRTLLYGVHGVGKSTFGAMAEAPIFIQTEDGLTNIDCQRFPLATKYADVIAALGELYTEPHEFRTVVVDSVDWLERLIWADVCQKRGVESIEDIGYGKGYVFALTQWREVLAGLDALRNDRGMAVILIAHAQIERFANPETDSYDRYAAVQATMSVDGVWSQVTGGAAYNNVFNLEEQGASGQWVNPLVVGDVVLIFAAPDPGVDAYEYLVSRGVPADHLDALIPRFDLRFDEQERRVVFPVRDGGRDLGYTARSIDAKERKRWLSHPVEGGHKTTIYNADRVQHGGNTLFVVEGPFDALMVTAAMQRGNDSVATAFFGSLPTDAQLALVVAAVPFYRMVYMMLDANVWGRCRRLARGVSQLAGVPNVGAINIGFEYRDPGATRFEELQRLVAFASASWAPEIHWMWERRLAVGGAKGT